MGADGKRLSLISFSRIDAGQPDQCSASPAGGAARSRVAIFGCRPCFISRHERPVNATDPRAAASRCVGPHLEPPGARPVRQESPGEAGTQPGLRSMPESNMSWAQRSYEQPPEGRVKLKRKILDLRGRRVHIGRTLRLTGSLSRATSITGNRQTTFRLWTP